MELYIVHGLRCGEFCASIEMPINRHTMNALIEIWFVGAYDSLESSSGAVIIDAGANVGMFTLRASGWVGNEGRIIAVEPIPVNRILLKRNLARNGIENVTVVEKALSDRVGTTEIAGFSVETTTIDRLIEDLHLPKVDCVKMDIEGFEVRALREGKNALRDARRVAVETHSSELEEKTRSLLVDFGFEVDRDDFDTSLVHFFTSMARNAKPFVGAEIRRIRSWEGTGGPFLWEPVRWLKERRKPDWFSMNSALKMLIGRRPTVYPFKGSPVS